MKIRTADVRRVRGFALVVLCLYFTAPCFVSATRETSDLPVGRWKCGIEYGSWIIERNADGTFEKKGKLVQMLGQPPQDFAVKGRWRLETKDYIEIWDQVSPENWRELKGSTRRAKVLLLERDTFRRIQSDSPVFIETRIR
jgi:hypothetical protein